MGGEPTTSSDSLAASAVRFLERYVSLAPQYPTVGLWRCWEAALFTELQLREPLLDLGCGDGSILESLLTARSPGERPSRVYGLDINAGSVATAAARSSYRGATVADARCQPYRDEVFASIISVCVLEHIPKVEAVRAEVQRILGPGGLFAFSVPTPRLLEVAAQTHPRDPEGYVHALNERVEHRVVWGPEAWRNALQAAGLEAREMRGFMPPDAAKAWLGVYDWVIRPIRGRGFVYRLAGPDLRRLGFGRMLAGYWLRRLRHWAEVGVAPTLDDACALFIVAGKP